MWWYSLINGPPEATNFTFGYRVKNPLRKIRYYTEFSLVTTLDR